MFLTLMAIGLAGLTVMALPALGSVRHGHVGGSHHHGGAFALRRLSVPFRAKGRLFVAAGSRSGDRPHGPGSFASRLLRVLPSPRLVFSLLALYGASGNVLVHVDHLQGLVVALVAVLPALLIERFAVTPLWNLVFRFQADPSSPLSALLLEEASAVTPFRNGRGLVAVVRDGRLVQFSARLVAPQSEVPVRVGDRLRIEEVDSDRERLTVSPRSHHVI
jgi:hypothetical protein